LADGRAEVHVRLHTKNALTWVINRTGCPPGSAFAVCPLLMGYRAPDVLAGSTPGLGESLLDVVYTATAPGAPLPDLLRISSSSFRVPGEEFNRIAFYARGSGPLRLDFGAPEGTPGRVEVTEVGLLDVDRNGAEPPLADSFPVEHINLFRVGR